MRVNRLALGLAMGLVMAVTIGSARAEERDFTQEFSGGFISTHIDTNGDGVKARFGVAAGKSGQLGTILFEIVTELLPLSSATTCPTGNLESEFVGGHGIIRENKKGSLLFIEGGPGGNYCLDPATNTFTFSGSGDITGGTGEFEGATGSFEIEGTGTILVSDPTDNEFGSQVGKLTGTIISPDEE
jgi:hypothetical protein